MYNIYLLNHDSKNSLTKATCSIFVPRQVIVLGVLCDVMVCKQGKQKHGVFHRILDTSGLVSNNDQLD